MSGKGKKGVLPQQRVLPQKGVLPHGWVVKQSNTYKDRVYYFNTNTGVSTWELPNLLDRGATTAKEAELEEVGILMKSLSLSQAGMMPFPPCPSLGQV